MSWFVEFLGYQLKKGVEDINGREAAFDERMKDALGKQEAERKYADMSSKPKYRFAHLQMDPYYEQRNKMFPHQKFVRRGQSSS